MIAYKISLNCDNILTNTMWYQGDEDEDEDLMCSPAILARRASESWINVPPVEVSLYCIFYKTLS